MTRPTNFLLSCTIAFLTVHALVGTASAESSATRPNVVLIVVDTLRADHLGTYGFPHGSSPNIDALAAQGVVFEQAIAASSRTAPSHASIMTSTFVRENSLGFRNGTTRLEGLPTLAAILSDAGYQTAAFIGNMLLQSRFGLDHGFEVYDDDLVVAEKNRSDIHERRAEQTGARAIAWLDERGDAPFFLWLHLQDPHGPYTPPAPFSERIKIEGTPNEVELDVVTGIDGLGGIPEYQYIEGSHRLSEYRERYAGEILYADHWIGNVVAAAQRRSGTRETIVVLTADHGEAMGEAGRHLVHGVSCTPDVARVPLIIRAPGLAPGHRGELVHHVDILPTLLELTGLPIPEASRGHALGPVIRGETTIAERIVYCDIGDEIAVYRSDRTFHRLIGKSALAWAHTGRGRGRDPVWVRYRWNHDETFDPIDGGHSNEDEVRAYYRNVTPFVVAPPLDAEEIDQLRALGYVE